jgi:hypothetical protein
MLEANPYRVALIEWAQHKGELTLTTVYKEHPIFLDPKPEIKIGNGDVVSPLSFSDMSSEEYRDEDVRVQGILRGDRQIGDADFVRVFKIQPPYQPAYRLGENPRLPPRHLLYFGPSIAELEADLQVARESLDTAKQLVKQKKAQDASVENAKKQVQMAEAEVKQAEDELRLAREVRPRKKADVAESELRLAREAQSTQKPVLRDSSSFPASPNK